MVLRSDDLASLEKALAEAGAPKSEIEDLGGSLLLEFFDPSGNKLVAMQSIA